MLQASTDETDRLGPEMPNGYGPGKEQLQAVVERLRVETARLRRENRELRATLDAHVTRARSTALFGPVEMTAGTCIGPRR